MARILWLKTGSLYPADTGGRIRSLNMLKELHRRHEITYLSLLPRESDAAARDYADFASRAVWIDYDEPPAHGYGMLGAVATSLLTSRLPYVIWKYRSRLMAEEMARLHRETPFDLIICDYLFPSWSFLQAPFEKRPPAVLFQHNVEAMIWKRRAEVATGPMKAFSWWQWRRLFTYECAAPHRFDGVIAVSPDDVRIMEDDYGLTNVLGDVPTGVDIDYFAPLVGDSRTKPFIAFLGSMDWAANCDGVHAFVQEVWPEIRRKHPGLIFRIIGRNPPKGIWDLVQSGQGIEVTGTVADVRPCLQGAKAAVVPLRIGGGTRLKIFECLAAGIPVVSTEIGAEGLPVENEKHILLARDIPVLGAPLSRLLSDDALAGRIAEQGRALVCQHYSWAAATSVFENLMGRWLH